MNDRELLYALLRILRHIQNAIDAIYNEQRAQSRQQQPSGQFDVQSPIRLPPAVHDYYASEQRDRPKKSRIENTRLALEWIGAVAAIFAAIYTLRTLNQVRTQADAAQRQVSIMQRQLETTDRPWVEITKAEVKRFRFHRRMDNGKPMLDVDLKMVVTNVGRSAALNVRVRSVLIFQVGTEPDAELKQKMVCESQDVSHITPTGFVLFPGHDSGDRLQSELGLGSDETIPDHGIIVFPDGQMMVDPAFMGCVTYDIPGAQANPHHTGFSYSFSPRNANGVFENRAFRIGEVIPVRSLALVDNYLGFSDAN